MKIVTFQVVMTCTDDYFESVIKPIIGNDKTEQLCAEMMTEGDGGVVDMKATTDVQEA